MPFRCDPGLPFTANEEPSFDQILADPMVRLVMKRDSVEEAHVRQLAGKVRERLKSSAANRLERAGLLL